MRRRTTTRLVARLLQPLSLLGLALLCATSTASAAPEIELDAGYLRVVHLTDGMRSAAPKRDLRRIKETNTWKEAHKVGLDLANPEHPLVATALANKRYFYIFYKVLEGVVSDRPYVIQRIKKTVRNWTSLEEPPEETITYQVETFKLRGGTLKRADQHYLSFGLRGYVKREIIKEYEIGIGEIPGDAEGTSWPYESRILYKLNQPYQEEAELYDSMEFSKALTWTLAARFDAKEFSLKVPELGVDLPGKRPATKRAKAKPSRRGKGVVLTAGRGVPGIAMGASADAAQDGLSKALRVDDIGSGRDYFMPSDLSVFVDKRDNVLSVFTHPPFSGKTAKGIRHGSHRTDVMKKYGVPKGQLADAKTWRYPGISFTFDGFHEVVQISVLRLPTKR